MTEAGEVPAENAQRQYIAVSHTVDNYEKQFEREVPIELLAAQHAEAKVECLR
jgi:hypothetical protein